MIISSQKLFQNLKLQDDLAIRLKAWISKESKHVCICPLISIIEATWANNIQVGVSEN